MGTALVTGGGGFVGRHLVRQLVARGDVVRVLGRRQYEHLPAEVTQQVGSILETSDLSAAIDGVDCVYHVASLASSFGRTSEFERTNVEGTERVINACRTAGVGRLIYTSTPSVVFGRTGHVDGDESLPYPDAYLADYPRTKAEAEKRVLAAAGESLKTAAIRPHLVFGPEDNSLLPRVVDRSRRKRLRLVGEGKTPISVSYVENVAAAHWQAAEELKGEARCSGRAYFVNEDKPVTTEQWIQTLLAMAGEPRCEKRVSASTAYVIGAGLETVWRWTGRRSEPPMTRFVARQLSEPHSFVTTAAQRDFDYRPVVGWDDAIARTTAWAKQHFRENRESRVPKAC